MKEILDEYFKNSRQVTGNFPAPFDGYVGNLSASICRADVESDILTGKLDKHPAVVDAVEQLKTKGAVTSKYFPWIIQRAKEILDKQGGKNDKKRI